MRAEETTNLELSEEGALTTGAPLWQQKKASSVLFGWQTKGHVYPGTGAGKVHQLSKDKLSPTREIAAPKEPAAVSTTAVETTADSGGGVVVRCLAEGGKLCVRVESAGYHGDWNVQFPRNLREEGARYVVESVRESAQGGYYRAYGDIRKLVAGESAAGPAKRKPRRA